MHNTVKQYVSEFFIKQLKLELEAVLPIYVQKMSKLFLKCIYELYNYNENEKINIKFIFLCT